MVETQGLPLCYQGVRVCRTETGQFQDTVEGGRPSGDLHLVGGPPSPSLCSLGFLHSFPILLLHTSR